MDITEREGDSSMKNKSTRTDKSQLFLDLVENKWKNFIENQRNQKNLHYLFVRDGFFDSISSFQIISASWNDDSTGKQYPGYSVSLRRKAEGIREIKGEWNKHIQVEDMGLNPSDMPYTNEELSVLRSLWEEFEMDRLITTIEKLAEYNMKRSFLYEKRDDA